MITNDDMERSSSSICSSVRAWMLKLRRGFLSRKNRVSSFLVLSFTIFAFNLLREGAPINFSPTIRSKVSWNVD